MKKSLKLHIIIILSLWVASTHAQVGFQSGSDSLASARVPGMPLPQGLELNFQRLAGSDIRAIPVAEGFSSDEARIDGITFWQVKLKIPLILKPSTSLLLGFDYSERNYEFESPTRLESSVFREIEKETLKSREVTLYYNKSLDSKRFISARMDLALNGDLRRISEQRFTSFIRYSAAALYGWQPHKNLAHGVGIFLNYTLGRPSVYPVFLWNKKLNDRWGIEAKLPANFRFRRDLSEDSRLYLGYAIDGGSYVINGKFEPLSSFETAELRRSDVALRMSFEQRVYDYIWFKAGLGYSYNINLRVSEENSFDNESLIRNEVEPSFRFDFSLFVVPTEGLKRLFGF